MMALLCAPARRKRIALVYYPMKNGPVRKRIRAVTFSNVWDDELLEREDHLPW
jgi:hypothetical protein